MLVRVVEDRLLVDDRVARGRGTCYRCYWFSALIVLIMIAVVLVTEGCWPFWSTKWENMLRFIQPKVDIFWCSLPTHALAFSDPPRVNSCLAIGKAVIHGTLSSFFRTLLLRETFYHFRKPPQLRLSPIHMTVQGMQQTSQSHPGPQGTSTQGFVPVGRLIAGLTSSRGIDTAEVEKWSWDHIIVAC